MKTKINKLKWLFWVVLVLLLLTITSYSSDAKNQSISDPIILNDLIDHDPIVITTDAGFSSFPGNGIPGDPYIIENYNITTSSLIGILIDASGGSTGFNVSFIIRDCWITAAEVCIKIIDAYPSLVTIDNCTCVNTLGGDGVGIYLIRCNGATIINCDCINNFHTGIRLDKCPVLWVENNICKNNGDEGIFIDNNSNDGLFLNNKCEKNAWGIRNDFSHSNTFRYNNCTDNSYAGFGHYYGNDLVAENNTVLKNGAYGFQILSTHNGLYVFNLIKDTTSYGVYLEAGVDFCTLHHNNFIGNNGGGVQAEDDAVLTTQNATWYDVATNEGNYWDDYVGPGVYNIDGTANNNDPYPLNSIVIIPEFSSIVLGVLLLSLISLVIISLKKK
ncbi:MAG: right-handed parallel beta-helix repeat-containing protein [Asgard group archaeon]|nr:right-handed parallel beta-helix repeat-containing protein [Asgard group archaeon]